MTSHAESTPAEKKDRKRKQQLDAPAERLTLKQNTPAVKVTSRKKTVISAG
jgi:hypothetical protein